MVNTPAVTFHGHDTEAGNNNTGTNYHAHTASNEMATFTHPTTTQSTQHTETIQQQQQQQPTQHSTMMTGETSSRRNSYGDDAVINKTTQLYAATPRSTCDSAVIYISYALGILGFLVGLTWLIVLLITQGKDYEPFLARNYDIALKPFLMQLPYFMAATSFLLMAGKRNTTLAWFLFTVSNFCIFMFWLILIVPYFIQFAYSGDSTGGTDCPDITSDPVLVGGVNDTTELCRLRKGAAALSCAFIAIHFFWFGMGLIQTIRHWKTIIVLDAAYPSKQIWLLLLTIQACGLIIWAAGNLRLTYLGKNDVALWSNQILWTSTYIVTLVTIVAMVMTAYAILDATKLYVGITFLFHLCAMMLLWSVFVYEARWADDPSNGLGNDGLGNEASGINTNNERANKVVAAGLGIVTGVETIFTVLFAIAYKMMPDLFLTQPNLTGPAAV